MSPPATNEPQPEESERLSLYDCRPCGFRSWAQSGSLSSWRIAVCPCPRCGKRNGSAMRLLVGATVLLCLLIGHGAVVLHELSESTAVALAIIGIAILACSSVVFGAWRFAQRSGVRFFGSGFRPASERQ